MQRFNEFETCALLDLSHRTSLFGCFWRNQPAHIGRAEIKFRAVHFIRHRRISSPGCIRHDKRVNRWTQSTSQTLNTTAYFFYFFILANITCVRYGFRQSLFAHSAAPRSTTGFHSLPPWHKLPRTVCVSSLVPQESTLYNFLKSELIFIFMLRL